MEKAKTCTGLKVTVDILRGVYATGKKRAKDFVDNMKVNLNTNSLSMSYKYFMVDVRPHPVRIGLDCLCFSLTLR
jgi:hypothetical protein